MRKNLLLRLCLMTIALLSLPSCRQDILHEQETYNNSSAFQLTSKRISLNEAKHKAKLLPELEKVETGLKTRTKSNVQGKVVNYANGVSIDTDDVIYIENGPNYYTYTFRLIRENAPADAPVENLILSPLSDGSWKEELITYNLTAQERQTMVAGGAVNLTGKVTKEILQSGTYSSAIVNKNSWDNCYMITSSHYTTCSGGQHSHGEPAGELEDGNCPADQLSVLVVTIDIVCSTPGGGYTGTGSNESGTTPGGFNTSGGGATTNPTDPTGSNGSTNPENPCGGSGIPSQPQNPGSTLGNEECNNGTITLPNLPLSNPEDVVPCNKLKNLLDPTKGNIKPLITNGMYSFLDNIGNNESETGIYLKKSSIGKITAEIAPPSGDNTLPSKYDDNYFSEIHTHPSTTYSMFSYSDIYVMYLLEINAADHNAGLSSMILVCEDDAGVKQTYAIVFEDSGTMMEAAWANTPENAGCSRQDIKDRMDAKLEKLYNEEERKASPNYERVFLQFNFGKNIGLYKANTNLTGWSKLTISENSDTAVVTPINCN